MDRLGSLDATFLSIERPGAPMVAGSLAVFEGPAPTVDDVRVHVAARLDLVPRCRQRVHRCCADLARPVWVDDAGFDLADHVHAATLDPDDPSALHGFVVAVMATPLDRRRALWELWVVDGLAGGRWAVVAKVHHCLVDGIAGSDLLSLLLEADPAPVSRAQWAAAPEPRWWDLAVLTVAAVSRSVVAHLRRLVAMVVHLGRTRERAGRVLVGARSLWLQPSHRHSPLTGPVGDRPRRWETASVPLADVAAVRRVLGGTVNDAVLAAVAWGFGRLLRSRGVEVAGRTVMALVPVSLRADTERGLLDNRVAVSHALLPVGLADPVATHAAVRAHLDAVKASHETDASTRLLHAGDVVPHVLAVRVARGVVRAQQNLETIVTNVPGPQHPLHLCGRRMLEAYPFAPIAGRIRIAVAVWSYDGVLHLGLTGDRDGVPDLDVLRQGVEEGFDALVALARRAGAQPAAHGPSRTGR